MAEIDAALNAQHIVFDVDIHVLLLDAGDLHNDGQSVVGLVNVGVRHVIAGRHRFSSFETSSFFSCTSSSCDRAISASVMLRTGGQPIWMVRGLSRSARGK